MSYWDGKIIIHYFLERWEGLGIFDMYYPVFSLFPFKGLAESWVYWSKEWNWMESSLIYAMQFKENLCEGCYVHVKEE